MGPHVYGTIITPQYSVLDSKRKRAVMLDICYYDETYTFKKRSITPDRARHIVTSITNGADSAEQRELSCALNEYAEKWGYGFFDEDYEKAFETEKSSKPCGEVPIESNDNSLFGSSAGSSMFNTGTITGGADAVLGVDTAMDIKVTDSSDGWTISTNNADTLVNYNYGNGTAINYDVTNPYYFWHNGQLISSPNLVLSNWNSTDPGAGLPDVQEPVITKRRINNKKRLKYNGNK